MFVIWLAACGGMEPETPGDTAPQPIAPADDVPPDGAPTVESYASGAFGVLPAYEGLATVSGTAFLVRRLDGTTGVGFAASGLAADTAHEAHLHALPCAYEGGGHYLVDPALPAGEENEVWFTVTPDTDGNAVAWSELAFRTRGDAMSIVIHDPATAAKLACADLVPAEVVGSTATGPFAPFAAYEPIDETIGGTATLVVTPSGTDVTVSLTGLDAASSYASHVHTQPCAVLEGSGHYKLDPTEVNTLEENEIWLTPVPDAGGNATATYDLPGHPVRADAQSVVIHRVVGAESPKVACADLVRQDYTGLATGGTVAPLGGSTAAGSADLERRLDGVSIVSVELSGLAANQVHPVHLHRFPCAVLEGGGHTLLDPTLPEGEENELWVEVTASGAGTAARAVGVQAIVGPDAQSVVVHAPDATKIGCVDLTR